MLSFELNGGTPQVERFTERLRYFTLAESLGGVESLVAHPATMTHASMTAEARAAAGISESLVRLSVGIESSHDLIADLTQALDACLRTRPTPSRPAAQTASHRRDVVLLGAGAIARELIEQVTEHDHGRNLRIVAIIDRSGHVVDPDGLAAGTLAELSAHKKSGRSLADHPFGVAAAPTESIAAITANEWCRPILADLTPSSTAPLLDSALQRGFDLVLANKVPLAGDQQAVDELFVTAALHGRQILNEATVGAGLPVLDTIRKLVDSGDEVLSIEGCPSGTLGYILGETARGAAFSDALRSAIALGYTEPDPRVDLSGVDVARKALILARLIGYRGDPDAIQVESLIPDALKEVSVGEFVERVPELDAAWTARTGTLPAGQSLRYRARVTPTEISVGLVAVSAGDPLASLTGTDNQFAIRTRRYQQPLIITGPGAGAPVTASGVFADLLRLATSAEIVSAAGASPRSHARGIPAPAPIGPS
jgi:aspartokinase/homoserine dehydrogenase 1